MCQKVRSATAALEEELDGELRSIHDSLRLDSQLAADIDPRHAELLRSEAVL